MRIASGIRDNYVNVCGIPVDRIEKESLEGAFGANFVTDKNMHRVLERVVKYHLSRGGGVPSLLRLREYPFVYFIPVKVDVSLGEGAIVGTNRFLFLRARRLM